MREDNLKYILATKKVLIPVGAFFIVSIILLANFLLDFGLGLIKTTFTSGLHPQPIHFDIDSFFYMPIQEYLYYYGVVLLIALVVAGRAVYLLRSNFKNLNTQQKGSSRFTTIQELHAQYKAVPEKIQRYKGGGGVVISRTKNKLFIDDSPVNNLIIGTTRSGKGETFVFPTIDVYSRAEKQPSLILNDPKGELFAASKDTLEKRGYHTEVLNLLNPMESMSFNLLQLVKDAYKDGDYSTAQTLCNTLSYTLYYNPSAKDPMWQDSAMSLCNAMILAITDKCIKERTEDKISMFTVANMLSELGSQEIYDENNEPQNALDFYFKSLPATSVAKMQYATSNFAKGTTRGGIFTQTMSKLSIFTFDEIAKMTSKNNIDLKRVGFGKTIKGKGTPQKRIEIFFPNGAKETIKVSASGRFEMNFIEKLYVGDQLHFIELGDKQSEIISIKNINQETGKIDFEVIQENNKIMVNSIVSFDKPIAIFMITPDFDSSNHVIASIFVRQLYFVLAKNASLARGGKCYREVVFLLDEFGNMPSIEGMANIITVCLGRNIRFNLIIQAYAQLKNKYADDAATIDGNCGNTIYILTNDDNTAEKISKKLGQETINSTSRSGKGFSLDKNKTESIDGKSLLTPNELTSLKEGESVVIRVIKRQDKKKKRIKAYPIFNTGKTSLKYRWEYLMEDFDTDKSILDLDIHSLHIDTNPNDLLINWFSKKTNFEGEGELLEKNDEYSETQPEQEREESPVEESLPVTSFTKLTYENWRFKTVGEFFSTDIGMLKILESHFANQMSMSMEDIIDESMEDFYEDIKIFANNDMINRNVYQAVSGKIEKILYELKREKERV